MDIDQFSELVGNIFRHIFERYHFHAVKTYTSWIVNVVTFANDTTGLSISTDIRESLVNVRFCRLQKGGLSVSLPFDPPNGYRVDNIIAVIAPDVYRDTTTTGLLANGTEIEKLQCYAQLLEEYGGDILAGDFSIFPQLYEYVMKRFKERSDNSS